MNQFLTKRKSIFEMIFLSSAILIIIFSILLVLAMIFYPGGNRCGMEIDRFSLLYNGICDMSGSLALNGEPNLISSILLKIGVVVLTISLIFFFGSLSFFFQEKKSLRITSYIGTFFGITQGPILILVIFLNSFSDIHMIFVILSLLFQYLAVIFYAIVFIIDKKIPKINQYSFLILGIISIAFLFLIIIANFIGGMFNRVTQRLGANLFHFLSIVIYVIQGFGFYYYLINTDFNSVEINDKNYLSLSR